MTDDDLTLADLDVDEQIPEHRSVKEVVLPFDRLPGSDPRLGPEMKSTGEVMGTARSFGKAYDKAQDSTNKPIPESGTAVDLSADEFPDPTHRGRRVPRRGVRRALRAERGDGPDRGREARRDRPHRLPAARAARSGGRRGDHLLLDARLREGGARSYRPQGRRPRRDGRLRPAEARRELGRQQRRRRSTSGLSTSDTVYKRPRDRGDRL